MHHTRQHDTDTGSEDPTSDKSTKQGRKSTAKTKSDHQRLPPIRERAEDHPGLHTRSSRSGSRERRSAPYKSIGSSHEASSRKGSHARDSTPKTRQLYPPVDVIAELERLECIDPGSTDATSNEGVLGFEPTLLPLEPVEGGGKRARHEDSDSETGESTTERRVKKTKKSSFRIPEQEWKVLLENQRLMMTELKDLKLQNEGLMKSLKDMYGLCVALNTKVMTMEQAKQHSLLRTVSTHPNLESTTPQALQTVTALQPSSSRTCIGSDPF